jgi:hypothetical protein
VIAPSGSDYPRAHSDIQCFECLKYFRHEPDISAHYEAEHESTD